MKYNLYYFLIFLFVPVFLFFSCSRITRSAQTLPENNDFTVFYKRFIESILNADTDSFNSFLNPENGSYIIESFGALPDIKLITDKNNSTLFELNKETMQCLLLDEKLPETDCDQPEGYNKTGCFVQKQNSFFNERVWDYAEIKNEQQKRMIEKSAAVITHTVINTALFRCYFTMTDGRYYLSFIDLRKPCSA